MTAARVLKADTYIIPLKIRSFPRKRRFSVQRATAETIPYDSLMQHLGQNLPRLADEEKSIAS